ncbi:MAG TPA: MFS transporter [Streptosporangiaceae bacterium]|nr:MFS transporter [Streptosporangiaceae bacterium]
MSLATLMAYLDNNVVNVALPTIQRDLHLSVSGLEWVVSSYLLVFAGLLLAGGRLADHYGRRRIFLVGLVIFTASSLASGLAGDAAVLIASRAVQGLGAALMVPTTLAIILATFNDARERNIAVGIWNAIAALALAIGPLIAGLISQHLHWGWIFFINVPVGVITAIIALPAMDESRGGADGEARRLDGAGLVVSAVMLFSLVYALIEGQDRGWTSLVILGAFVLAAVALAGFLLVERGATQPMVTLSMFRSRVFSGGTATMMLWGFGVFGIYFFTALYLQDILGFSPTKAGLAFVPMALAVVVFSGLAGPIAARIRTHGAVAGGMLVMAVGLVLFALLGANASFAALIPAFVVFGAGAGLMNVPLTTAILGAMPPERSGIASALLNASREVAGLLGITVIGAVLRTRQSSALGDGVHPASAFLDGYHAGLYVTIALMVAGVAVSWLTLRRYTAERPAAPAEPLAAGNPETAVPAGPAT